MGKIRRLAVSTSLSLLCAAGGLMAQNEMGRGGPTGEAGPAGVKVVREVEKLFNEKDWKGIEAMAEGFRKTRADNEHGSPLLGFLYYALEPRRLEDNRLPDAAWEEFYEILEEWEREVPESLTVPGVKMGFWVYYAFHARWLGWDDESGEVDWDALEAERLGAAEGIFQRKLRIRNGEPFPCPGLYKAAARVASAQHWEPGRIEEEILRPVAAVYPRYISAYNEVIRHKRGHTGEDAYQYIATLPGIIGGEAGKEMCARVLMTSMADYYHREPPAGIDREVVKEGFVESFRHATTSRTHLHDVLAFAERYGDQEYLLKQAQEIAPEAVRKFFTEDAYGKAWRVRLEKPETSLERLLYIRPKGLDSQDQIESLTADVGTGRLSVSTPWNGIRIMPIDTCLADDSVEGREKITLGNAYSPDGKYLFYANRAREPKSVTVTSFCIRENKPRGKVLVEAKANCGTIEGIVFTPDGGKIIFMNRGYSQWGSVDAIAFWQWDWKTEGAVPEKFYPALVHLSYRSLTTDAEENALYSGGGSFFRFDLEGLGRKPVKVCTDPAFDSNTVKDFAFIDGGNITALSTWNNPRKGELALVDRSTGELLATRSMENVTGFEAQLCVTKSADGKKDIIVTSGPGGSMTTWIVNKKDGKYSIDLESCFPSSGHTTKSLIAFRTKEGKNLVIQGTENGMVGVFEVK